MSDCYCDYDAPEFYRSRMVAGRKPHRCDECRATIPVGERHEYAAGKWDDGVCSYRTCARCLAFRAYVTEHVKCFCWSFGDMLCEGMETLQEYAHELPGMWFGGARLLVKARRAKLLENRDG